MQFLHADAGDTDENCLHDFPPEHEVGRAHNYSGKRQENQFQFPLSLNDTSIELLKERVFAFPCNARS